MFKPMKCGDVRRILTNLGFTKDNKGKGTNHEQWRCYRGDRLYKVTLSCHHGEVKAKDIKSMISQAGVTKSQWYAALDSRPQLAPEVD